MYTQELGLTERLAIVDEIILLGSTQDNFADTLVPDNRAEIIIPLYGNATFTCIGSVRSIILNEGKGYFLMPRRRGAELLLSKGVRCLFIKINPIYAKKIAVEQKEISNGVFRYDLSQDTIRQLVEAYEAEDIYEASDLIEETINLDNLYEYNMTILDSVEQIRSACGTLSVKEIYSTLNISKSKLEQHFNREVGLTPKEFCKIEKINCFIKSYRENEQLSLTELTYQCGYYDQSHLIKDFKYFLDTSPKKFFNASSPGEGR